LGLKIPGGPAIRRLDKHKRAGYINKERKLYTIQVLVPIFNEVPVKVLRIFAKQNHPVLHV
jgi:hypothetical protein